VKLCMFAPVDRELERGWPGRIDGERVVQLAAQTLQAFFTGGGEAREHAEYALDEILLRAPVLHPPSVRVFDDGRDFVFSNPASIYGPNDVIPLPTGAGRVESERRLAAVIGAGGEIGGVTLMNDWFAPELAGAKQRDFATSLGPILVTPDELELETDWLALVGLAGRSTRLLPGDVLAAGSLRGGPHVAGDVVEVELDGIGVLRNQLT
jgi:2-keto-4-pentenoate hydratase/2-oxohepta-3-ene-1,7-dioic acid hydratase in catechol pathway